MVSALLDNTLDQSAGATLLDAPERIVVADTAQDVAAALTTLQTALNDGYYAAGFLSYELGYLMDAATENLQPKLRDIPLLWFALSRTPEKLTNAQTSAWLGHSTYAMGPRTPLTPKPAYIEKCKTALARITAGDVYQINLTMRAQFIFSGEARGLYADMRTRQPCAYAAFIDTGTHKILSASPELFFEKRGCSITTKPMKGTAPRGHDAASDTAQKNTLATDPKQRAENVMIVDLMRNDLGRIALQGSVKADTLFEVETYKTLHQLTSRVTAALPASTTLAALLRALFPAGSITGAPKISAMQLISQLEDAPRGVYCGAIGLLEPNGDARFNVAIRTITIQANQGTIGIGSGIVADSAPDDEYDECLLKMKFLETQPSLIETMYWDGGHFTLLPEHLARLETSATHLGIQTDIPAISTSLNAATANLQGRQMVRLLLAPDGTYTITAKPLTLSDAPIRFKISSKRTSAAWQWLYHKTTDRAFYDDEFAAVTADASCDEVVFLNEADEITEGSRTNIFIQKNGLLLTPPLTCGVLAGTLRANLLANGKATESLITLADIESADAVFLGNSLRGLRLARLIG